MSRRIALAALVCVVGSVASGCVLDRHRQYRPTRFQAGVTARQYTVPVAPRAAAGTRTTTSAGSEERTQGGLTGAAQFTMSLRRMLYVGGELEAGTLQRPGSNIAAGYAVVGAEHSSRHGALAVELVGGYRALRSELGATDIGAVVLEPRLRGQVWMSPQLSLGVVGGANLEDGAWMAGLYLGVHSELWNAWKR